MMSKIMQALTIAAASLCLPGWANASLIGDTVDFGVYNAFTGIRATGFGLEDPFIVQEGTVDQKQYSVAFLLNVEAEQILVDFINPASTNVAVLRGVDLDWVGMPYGQITDLLIDTNLVGWDDSRASFSAHEVAFNWTGIPFTTNSFFNAQLVHVIPIPASVWLFGSALLYLGFLKKRKAA